MSRKLMPRLENIQTRGADHSFQAALANSITNANDDSIRVSVIYGAGRSCSGRLLGGV